MGSLERRLERLETANGATQSWQDATVRREALHRMTDNELDVYEAAAVRSEAGEESTVADPGIVARARELYEEVARELVQKA